MPLRGRSRWWPGCSNLLGKPMGKMLLAADATVIAVGISRVHGRLVGDVDFPPSSRSPVR